MCKKYFFILPLLFISNFALTSTAPTQPQTLSDTTPSRPTQAIDQFINRLVKQYDFNKNKLSHVMSQAEYDPGVIKRITNPFEKKPWDFYRRFFLRQDRIDNGVQYWNTHKKILSTIQNRYHIDPSIIVAIIGIESFYGKHAGTYNVLNALTTLSFYYPKRQSFFQSELTEYLLLTRHEKLNPLILRGSYAGALGIPQFMPSSYRQYGIDYSKKQSIDLFTNHPDSMASIANFITKAGWKPGKPVAVPAIIKKEVPKSLISEKAIPKYTLNQLHRYGIYSPIKLPGSTKVALIVMNNSDSDEYWLVFQNFRAIMRYNPRTTYALAVYELSRAIRNAYEQKITTSTATTSARESQRS